VGDEADDDEEEEEGTDFECATNSFADCKLHARKSVCMFPLHERRLLSAAAAAAQQSAHCRSTNVNSKSNTKDGSEAD